MVERDYHYALNVRIIRIGIFNYLSLVSYNMTYSKIYTPWKYKKYVLGVGSTRQLCLYLKCLIHNRDYIDDLVLSKYESSERGRR